MNKSNTGWSAIQLYKERMLLPVNMRCCRKRGESVFTGKYTIISRSGSALYIDTRSVGADAALSIRIDRYETLLDISWAVDKLGL